jgi:hypothetical protein
MSDDLGDLRIEIERLLAQALRDDERHAAEVERRDQLHLSELERRDQRHLEETEARDKLHVAETVARDSMHVRELEARDELHAQELETIRRALETRDLIGQAKGVIMASMGCSPDESFMLIVKQSQHENRKVTDVAAEIVQRATSRRRQAGS